MGKTNKKVKKCFGILAAVALLMSGGLNASTPVWTYSAPSPASVEVFDGEKASVQYIVTNQSRNPKNLLLKATAPGVSASSACHLPGKGSSCVLTLTINGSLVPNQGIHDGPVLCEQGNPNQCYQPGPTHVLNVSKGVTISMMPNNINIEAGETSGVITIKNESSTMTANALNFTADINLVNNGCTSPLPPQGSCSFQVQSIIRGQYSVTAQGSNTTPATLTINVSEVMISLSPTALNIPVNSTGAVTVTNKSNTTAVINLQVNNLPVGITVDTNASSCAINGSLPANGTCSLVFAATAETGNTEVSVAGDNTNEAPLTLSATTTTISIVPPSAPPLILDVDGVTTLVFEVQNTGLNAAANIEAEAEATPAWVGVTIAPSAGCAELAPSSNNCTISVSSSVPNVAGYLVVKGNNTNAVNTNYIAFRAGGGLVFSREENVPSPGQATIKVVAESDDSTNLPWDSSTACQNSFNCTLISMAQSLDNGQDNTSAIVAVLNSQSGVTSTNYAAGLCNQKDGGSNGWFLPAICELGIGTGSPVGGNCTIPSIYANLYAHNFPVFSVPGFTRYWSSSQFLNQSLIAQSMFFAAGSTVGQSLGIGKFLSNRIRCVRAFIS